MNACMHDYAKEHRKHGVVKSLMLESRVNTPLVRTMVPFVPVSRVLHSSQSRRPSFGHCRLTGLTPGPTTFARKSRLSVVSRVN